jgi:hypothetical protein
MNSKELIIYNAGYWKWIKGFHEQIIGSLVVFREALRSKIKMLSHLAALMVSSKQNDAVRIV